MDMPRRSASLKERASPAGRVAVLPTSAVRSTLVWSGSGTFRSVPNLMIQSKSKHKQLLVTSRVGVQGSARRLLIRLGSVSVYGYGQLNFFIKNIRIVG